MGSKCQVSSLCVPITSNAHLLLFPLFLSKPAFRKESDIGHGSRSKFVSFTEISSNEGLSLTVKILIKELEIFVEVQRVFSGIEESILTELDDNSTYTRSRLQVNIQELNVAVEMYLETEGWREIIFYP